MRTHPTDGVKSWSPETNAMAWGWSGQRP